ncbi:hypothetical protein CHUAL_001815 [Chamberlinius hualienensis]
MLFATIFSKLYAWASQIPIDNQLQIALYLMTAILIIMMVKDFIREKVFKGTDLLKNLPGPTGLPFVGYLPFIQKNFYSVLCKLSEKYGPVYRIFLGNKLVVVLSDYRVIKQAFRSEAFSGRPHNEFTQILEGYGIVNTEGELWKEQRRYVHEKLKNFGARNNYNRDLLEKAIMKEVNETLDVIAEQSGKPYNFHHILASSLSNVICSMLLNIRFDHRDKKFLRFLHLMDEGMQLFSVAAPASYVPGLRYVPGINWAYNQIVKNREEMFEFFKQIVEDHKATRDPTKARDFVDEYLMEIDKQTNNNCEEDEKKRCYFSERQLYQVIGDLFSTGLEPVKDTLQWAIYYMVTHPEVQEKIQEELDGVVGSNRLPSLTDMPRLPYTNATVLEVLRKANIIGIGTSRCTLTDTELCGFKIPKDAQVVPLIWAVHMDPKLWKDPNIFDPSRFIDQSGHVFKPNHFLPFSTGRRMCIGEVLAKTEIFLFLSSLLHRFSLTIPEDYSVTDIEIGKSPVSQLKVSAILRKC